MSERILIHFPETERAAEQLMAHAGAIEQTQHRMNRSAEALFHAGLEGQFVDELDARLALVWNWFSTCAAEVYESGQDLATVSVLARQVDNECALLFQTRGPLEAAAAIALLQQGWDGGYTGWPPDQADMIFINGIRTPYDGAGGHLSTVEGLQARFGDRHVMGIYNLSEGSTKDTLQALQDAFQTGDYDRLITNPAVDSLVRTIEQNPGRPYELMVHSQGAAITAAALCVLASRGVDLSHLKVNTFGGAGIIYPKGPAYSHYTSVNDPVSFIRATGAALYWDSMTENLPFEVDPIVDNLHIVPGRTGHALDQYLAHYEQAKPLIPSFVTELDISARVEHAGQIWKQTTSLGDWGQFDTSLLDTRFNADATLSWVGSGLAAHGSIDAHAYLGSFDLQADVAGFDAAMSGYLGAEASIEGNLVFDPLSGDIGLDAEAGVFAGSKVTGEVDRDFGAVEAEGRAGISYGVGATINADVGFRDGVFAFEIDGNVAAGLGINAGVSAGLDVNEAVTSVTRGVTELTGRLMAL